MSSRSQRSFEPGTFTCVIQNALDGDWAGGFYEYWSVDYPRWDDHTEEDCSATAIGRMRTLRKAIGFVTRYSQYTPYFRKVNRGSPIRCVRNV